MPQPYPGAHPHGTPQPGGFAGAQPYPQANWQPQVAPQPFLAPNAVAQGAPDLRSTANATAGLSDRLRFIRMTYAHLFGAILVFAGLLYLLLFSALTASVFVSKKDFSFLRSGLMLAGGASLTLIALSLVFGFNLGIVFSIGMVLLAAGYILYQTSQIMAHYDPRNHVAAALALFSSVALMFWYVIRIFLRMRQ
jgi:hypothetical protein